MAGDTDKQFRPQLRRFLKQLADHQQRDTEFLTLLYQLQDLLQSELSRQQREPTNALTVDELLQIDTTVRNGQRWGNWCYDQPRQRLVYRGAPPYEIDLKPKTSPMNAVQWIDHMTGKDWCTAEDLGDLVMALKRIIGLNHLVYGGKQ